MDEFVYERLAHPTQRQAAHGNAELGRRERAVFVGDQFARPRGASDLFCDQLFNPAQPGADRGVLGGHKKRVGEQQQHHAKQTK